MRKIYLILIILLSTNFGSFAQKFPIPVRPGDTINIITKNKSFNLPAKNDTLWILKNTQLQNAIIKAKNLELSELEITELKNQIFLYKNQGSEKDSLVSVVKKDRDFYQKSWKTCDKDLRKLIRMQKRQSLYTKLALAGIPVAFVIGFFVAL